MADAVIQIAPDSTGKMVDNESLTVGANTVYRQRTRIAGGSAGDLVGVFPAGFLRTTDEPTTIFYDSFDSALDTTVRWSAPLTGGGGVAAANASGATSIGSGTTANSFSSLESQPKFVPTIPGWIGFSNISKLPNTTNAYSFTGAGTQPSTPTPAAPLTDAFGFECDTSGNLCAVVYASGVRTQVALIAAQGVGKNDGNYHRFIVSYRTDRIFWFIDTLDTYVASTPAAVGATITGPSVQTLPVKFLSAVGATPPATSAVITCSGVAVWDTAKNSHALKDAVYGWRTAKIDAAGALSTSETSPLIAQSFTATVSGNTAIYTPTAGKSVRLYYIAYSADSGVGTGQVRAAIRFGPAGVLRYAMRLTGNQAFARGISGGRRYIQGAVNEVLNANQDVNATVDYSFELDEV